MLSEIEDRLLYSRSSDSGRRPLAKIEILKNNESVEIQDDKGNIVLTVYNDPVSGMINIRFRQNHGWRINT